MSVKLSIRQYALLLECVNYSISEFGGEYYRLGGHGLSGLRHHPRTLQKLSELGLVEYNGYWTATIKGIEVVNQTKREDAK